MYLSSRGYAVPKEGNDDLIQKLKEDLTVVPKTQMTIHGINPTSFSLFRESVSMLYVPKYYGLMTFGIPEKNKLHSGKDVLGLTFNGSLRKEQMDPVNAFIRAAHHPCKMGGIISIGCGGGKTVIGLYLASVFKKKTLIVCHKEFLMNQWRERITAFLPQARIGRIKQARVDIENCDIVIASLQSLAMRDYPASTFTDFGFVIYDECHHNGAEVFSQSMLKMTIPITLGLSATLNRKDGLRKVFEWYLGKPVYEKKREADADVIVKMIKYFDSSPEYSRERLLWNGRRNTPQMLNALTAYAPRNEVIIDALAKVLAEEPGRKTIILSERRNQLAQLAELISNRNLGSYGFYVGGMKQDDLKTSEGKDIILGTYMLVSEGFDVPALNTLVFASPISSIEQSLGRIQRQKACQRTHIPLVIDLWDDFSLYRNQGYTRIKHYKKNGYTVTYTQIKDSELQSRSRTQTPENSDEEDKNETVDFIDDDDE
jgi:superfamily II DNA or RNA helicase